MSDLDRLYEVLWASGVGLTRAECRELAKAVVAAWFHTADDLVATHVCRPGRDCWPAKAVAA